MILAKDRQTEQRRAVKVNPDHFRGETVGKNAVKTHRFRHVEPRNWGVFFLGKARKRYTGEFREEMYGNEVESKQEFGG